MVQDVPKAGMMVMSPTRAAFCGSLSFKVKFAKKPPLMSFGAFRVMVHSTRPSAFTVPVFSRGVWKVIFSLRYLVTSPAVADIWLYITWCPGEKEPGGVFVTYSSRYASFSASGGSPLTVAVFTGSEVLSNSKV